MKIKFGALGRVKPIWRKIWRLNAEPRCGCVWVIQKSFVCRESATAQESQECVPFLNSFNRHIDPFGLANDAFGQTVTLSLSHMVKLISKPHTRWQKGTKSQEVGTGQISIFWG